VQFDLFIDAPDQPMNPNKSHIPDCFESDQQYYLWRADAYRANEPALICEDCTDEYKSKMKKQGRCHELWTREHGIIYRTKELPSEVIRILQIPKERSPYKPQGSGGDKGNSSSAHGTDLQLFVRAWTSGQRWDRQADWVEPKPSGA
jgi:hypothetical protein